MLLELKKDLFADNLNKTITFDYKLKYKKEKVSKLGTEVVKLAKRTIFTKHILWITAIVLITNIQILRSVVYLDMMLKIIQNCV